MKYLCLAYGDEEKFNAMSKRELDDLMEKITAYDAELKASGHLISGMSLGWSATTLQLKNGKDPRIRTTATTIASDPVSLLMVPHLGCPAFPRVRATKVPRTGPTSSTRSVVNSFVNRSTRALPHGQRTMTSPLTIRLWPVQRPIAPETSGLPWRTQAALTS